MLGLSPLASASSVDKRSNEMKIKWVEPKEDDPIFKSGFVFSPKKNLSPKKNSKSLNVKREIKKNEENKKKGD